MTASQRHSWSEPHRTEYRTERVCVRCELIRVTRHEPGQMPWTEWWRGDAQIFCAGTPPCTAKIGSEAGAAFEPR